MRTDGLCATATCDSEYPPRVAFSLLGKTMEDFDAACPTWKVQPMKQPSVRSSPTHFSLRTLTHSHVITLRSAQTEKRNEAIVWPMLEELLAKYQDPASADQIMKIQVSRNENENRKI